MFSNGFSWIELLGLICFIGIFSYFIGFIIFLTFYSNYLGYRFYCFIFKRPVKRWNVYRKKPRLIGLYCFIISFICFGFMLGTVFNPLTPWGSIIMILSPAIGAAVGFTLSYSVGSSNELNK